MDKASNKTKKLNAYLKHYEKAATSGNFACKTTTQDGDSFVPIISI